MFKNKGKIRSSLTVARSESSLLRMLRSGIAFHPSPSPSIAEQTRTEGFCNFQRVIDDAVLKAEQDRAKAIMASTQRRYF